MRVARWGFMSLQGTANLHLIPERSRSTIGRKGCGAWGVPNHLNDYDDGDGDGDDDGDEGDGDDDDADDDDDDDNYDYDYDDYD